jgi:prepilin-type N-terminal cleavage/methylation domain-containing protein
VEWINMELTLRKKKARARNERGMTLIELMIALVVLLVGVVGSMSLVALSIGGNGRSRQQSNSVTFTQMVTEKIASINASSTTALTITDCSGNNFNVSTAVGGANLLGSGDVDFTQSPAPANYSMTYNECGTAGRTAVYDVRWNIQAVNGSSYVKLLTVSARMQKAGGDLKFFSLPVTITTLIGQGT